MIAVAEMLTGTPSRVSRIMSPEEISFTARASRQYFRGLIYWSHLRTGGIDVRWTTGGESRWSHSGACDNEGKGRTGTHRNRHKSSYISSTEMKGGLRFLHW
jgi:hypothetical protein